MTAHACGEVIRQQWEGIGAREGSPIEITISTQPPLVRTPFTECFTCPHGISYYLEPTREQVARFREAMP